MSWDWEQMFTPPSSKSPWTAMTHGSTGEWARDIEPWGETIMAASSKIPYIGPIVSAGMGAAGFGGRGTGYIGSDYGDANYGSTIVGAAKGASGGDWKTAVPNALSGTTQSIVGEDMPADNSEANKYNSSWYGGILDALGVPDVSGTGETKSMGASSIDGGDTSVGLDNITNMFQGDSGEDTSDDKRNMLERERLIRERLEMEKQQRERFQQEKRKQDIAQQKALQQKAQSFYEESNWWNNIMSVV